MLVSNNPATSGKFQALNDIKAGTLKVEKFDLQNPNTKHDDYVDLLPEIDLQG